ncbi:uncharacterized protein A1O9_00872 [Exophiala aquamarina CBS 119918]|uniref:C2H2-type domain-containing protein n=1 Tax=Exophiala aquamarina CBS 119918 TaxID=1182545 RepID=A0A072PU75_9EURO|nr:uncharacterized protein A1O9_00872 [Exophiala aquamarina CBS 119918]KEF62898.1 hypothetical protein A1O9_00872 [Exophiala aquamarina CBS 119918]
MTVLEVAEAAGSNSRTMPIKPRPYSCSLCDTAFTRAAHLRRHENSRRITSDTRLLSHTHDLDRYVGEEVLLSHMLGGVHTKRRDRAASPAQQPDSGGGIDVPPPLQRVPALSENGGSPEEGASQRTPSVPPMYFPASETLSQVAPENMNFLHSSLTPFEGWSIPDVVMADGTANSKELPDHSARSASQGQVLSVGDPVLELRDQGSAVAAIPGFDEYFLNHFSQKSPPYRFSDQGYEQARANLILFAKGKDTAQPWFPSKYVVIRFVKAFFQHMTPHLPIIHEPTFDITVAPPPLLYQVMAFGALYLTENDIAFKLHTIGTKLIIENQQEALFSINESPFALWTFQSFILINVFKAYTAASLTDSQALRIFSFTIQLARQSLPEVQKPRSMIYKEWVYEESVSRCLAWCVVLAAMFGSQTREQFFSFPLSEKGFPLPSHHGEWQLDEAQWLGLATQPLDHLETFTGILSGQRRADDISTFGLLALTASLVCRICSFERSFTLEHPFLYRAFAAQMDQPLEILNDMWSWQARPLEEWGSTRDPLAQCTNALLSLAFLHLYGSQPLDRMKKILIDPSSYTDVASLFDFMSDQPHAPVGLHKALVRAAEDFRHDCRIGIGYLQKVAPHRFSPLSASSMCETALLLTWYQASKTSGQAYVEYWHDIEVCLTEAAVELCGSDVSEKPLELSSSLDTYAKMLDKNTVWQWPVTLARLMSSAADQIRKVGQ